MPELAGQRHTGTPLTEKECYSNAIEGLRMARDSLRGLALLRGDGRWLLPVRLLEEIADRVTKLKDRGGPSLIWLPDRDRRG